MLYSIHHPPTSRQLSKLPLRQRRRKETREDIKHTIGYCLERKNFGRGRLRSDWPGRCIQLAVQLPLSSFAGYMVVEGSRTAYTRIPSRVYFWKRHPYAVITSQNNSRTLVGTAMYNLVNFELSQYSAPSAQTFQLHLGNNVIHARACKFSEWNIVYMTLHLLPALQGFVPEPLSELGCKFHIPSHFSRDRKQEHYFPAHCQASSPVAALNLRYAGPLLCGLEPMI